MVPDSAVHLSNYILFRRDRLTHAVGVCIFVNAEIPCSCLRAYESSDVESIWVKARPQHLPRQVSMILVGTVYHPATNTAEENQLLLHLIQDNVESFLRDHPEGLIFICGDFNPTSTRLTELVTKRVTGLTQIVKVKTRDSGTLDWCLSNRPKLMASPKQLPKLGTTDHYSILIYPPQASATSKNTKIFVERRDLRASRMRDFGRWITGFDWNTVTSLPTVQEKPECFNNILTNALTTYLPIKKFRVCSNNKPWVTEKCINLISRRQMTLSVHGKDSDQYNLIRNQVQKECKACKERYYSNNAGGVKSRV